MNMLKCHPEATDMWRKPHCIKIAVRQDSQRRSVEYKTNIVYGRKKHHVFWQYVSKSRVFVYGESCLQTGNGCQRYKKQLWCITGAPQTSAKKAATGRTFFSERCELTEDKQVSRCVGSSRKIDYCTGISQKFEPRDGGYPGVVQWEHMCRVLCNWHRPGLKPKRKSAEQGCLEGCECQGHVSSSVLCPTHQTNCLQLWVL